jgi:Lar family restriction alleviation protein
MAEVELKRCPCGGEAVLLEDRTKYYKYHVVCRKCGAITQKEHISAIAIAQWNRRVKDGRE